MVSLIDLNFYHKFYMKIILVKIQEENSFVVEDLT
jgi:hypothetical protein